MSYLGGFVEGFTGSVKLIDDLKTTALKRRLDQLEAERADKAAAVQNKLASAQAANYNAITETENQLRDSKVGEAQNKVKSSKYETAQNALKLQFLRDTYPNELAYRKQELERAATQWQREQNLAPSIDALAKDKIDAERNALGNTNYATDVANVLNIDQANAVLAKHNKGIVLALNADGTVSVKDTSGKEIGSPLPYEQAMSWIKTPQAYDSGMTNMLMQKQLQTEKAVAPQVTLPIVSTATAAPSGAGKVPLQVNIPANLQTKSIWGQKK